MELDAVSRTYPGPPRVDALRPSTLRVARGDHVAITGPSGSGKSTLLNVLGLLDEPTGGRYRLAGVDAAAAPERTRVALRAGVIGFVFQAFHLLPARTSLANVELGMLYSRVARRERRARAREALQRVGLPHRVDALPVAMSGGEQQRVAVARAIVNRPQVLLCDEPTGNLDSENTASVLDLLDSLNHSGLTIVVVTHEEAVAARASRRLHVRDGVVTEAT